jgi:L-iditol 2-dehydrogenase
VNPSAEDLSAAITRDLGPDRADLILECVGAQGSIDDAIANARKGTTIVVVGVFGEKPRVDLGLVQDRELSLVGTLMYQKPDWEKAISLVADGKMNLDPMVTHHVAFDEFLSAYELIEEAAGESLKVMVTLD